jgi:hypothetical protein
VDIATQDEISPHKEGFSGLFPEIVDKKEKIVD